MSERSYDSKTSVGVLKHARKVEHKSLREVFGGAAIQRFRGKGKLGQALEELLFEYPPNSIDGPDFPEAGVELKTSPLKRTKSGLVSKERLVLNIIKYMDVHRESFETSSFWKKNRLLLLMFFIWKLGQEDIDYVFEIVRLWDFPEKDKKIIRDDWEKIVRKIRAGLAHELSEGDTMYLGACTKGANKETKRKQPFSTIPAKQRAFALKSFYLNFIIKDSLRDSGEAVKKISQYRPGETFEEYVQRRFSKYYGKTERQLFASLGIRLTSAKDKFYHIAAAILGVKGRKIAELEKAGVLLKTVRVESNGSIRESMSFNTIDYDELMKERWETSYWLETLNRRFLFVVFQNDGRGNYRLKKVFFWAMPIDDLRIVRRVWLDTKCKVRSDDYTDFIKESANMISHVRPKARNAADQAISPISGKRVPKKCFWLNKAYIRAIVEREFTPHTS